MMSLTSIAGIAGGILAVAGFVPYILAIFGRDLLFHRVSNPTKPNRATWFIWAVVSGMILASYYEAGARDTIWVPTVLFIETLTVAILSITHGVGGWGRLEKLCSFGAVASGVLWAVSGSPVLALIAYITLDFFGALPTIQKSYSQPKTENRLAWSFSFAASVANVVALGSMGMWTLGLAVYPLYMLVANGLIFGLLLRSRGYVNHSY